jgi:hypothetical protein
VVSAFLVAVAPAAFAQEAEARERSLREQIAELSAQVQAAGQSLVNPIRVNGVQLDRRRVLREVVFLTGGELVEAKVVEFFIEEGMQVAIEAGRNPEEFEISEDEILQTVTSAQAKFIQQNPGVDFWEVLAAQMGLEKDTLVHQKRQGILFERVFFPGTPST